MADSSEVKALEKISTEVGDCQIKITLSNQCIKAQAFLVDKLRKQVERQKEICNFISNSNFKLQTEIKQAESEIKSLTTGHNTIKAANVELKKDCLIIKERKTEIEERVRNGEKKYEEMWIQARDRYETIPFVQKLLQANNKTKILKETILTLDKESQDLIKEKQTKKQALADLDKKRIIEMAEFLVNYLPRSLITIKEKSVAINNISKEIDEMTKRENVPITSLTSHTVEEAKTADDNDFANKINDGWLNICQHEQDTIMMPKIHLINSDFDVLSAKLDKIKIKKVDNLNVIPTKRADAMQDVTEISCKRFKKDEDISPYFNKPFNKSSFEDENRKDNYSRKKLINILEDIKIDNNDAFNIVSKVNPEKLYGVDKIGVDHSNNEKQQSKAPEKIEQENEVIEEIDLTKATNDNLLIPPTQFLDLSQGNIFSGSQQQVEVIVHMAMTDSSTEKVSQTLKNSQENYKKRVSFDLPQSIKDIKNEISLDDNKTPKENEDNKINETIDSQVDISLTSDESYTRIKEIMLKKHNLDLSPQFVYAKNNMQTANNEIITSKFFQPNMLNISDKNGNKITEIVENADTFEKICNDPTPKQDIQQNPNDTMLATMDVNNEVIVSSPKVNTTELFLSDLLHIEH